MGDSTAPARCYGSGVFTGLVEQTGQLETRQRRGPGYRLRIRAALGPLVLGESIAVNGACLTVVTAGSQGFEADVSAESAEKTTLGRLAVGASVNLERALRLGDRLGGHLVGGHVDAVVQLLSVTEVGDARRLELELPSQLRAYLAPKGSVALDGVSLTVNGVQEGSFSVMLIPHTSHETTLAQWRVGSEINLEVDLLARYVVSALQAKADPVASGSQAAPPPDFQRTLERAGFL